ncbi:MULTISPECIES: type 1 glutamine amidotransferase domain-containing protein [unclassified Variovorax]|uniref:type 1 glutamine amidotransferase domain-containing protein n=1 Tax=unclassified Variovorax TaxID=663243 RepID=UPI00076CEE7A|nr:MULTISPECIES: type 1 glutamine amidotransferase domain-containing protein [unclassified Variovorax]KWT91972.1 ThiJ/PfpI family protein [Variovorax sp. WDL1]PNG59354.1 General stress protein 18 [Variovorax sp. B4]PNG60855.1 General stress protein 18 [Variovorax sp. B2]VTV13224.1 General stress protein 18 [Variovorax sp. WDL1]
MIKRQLEGMKVAILVTDGFEQSEMTEPRRVLDAAGADTSLISPAKGGVRGWKHHTPADRFDVDVPLQQAAAHEYDALVLPGGVMSPDALRIEEQAVAFVRDFVKAGKPIAAICHGPWTLIEADAVKGRTMTSWPSLRTDLKNAGAKWVDLEVVADGPLITSRKPADLPAFNRVMLETFAGVHAHA